MNSLAEYRQTALQKALIRLLRGEEGFSARIPGFRGLIVFGGTELDARNELASALDGWIELSLRQGRGLPAIKATRMAAISAR